MGLKFSLLEVTLNYLQRWECSYSEFPGTNSKHPRQYAVLYTEWKFSSVGVKVCLYFEVWFKVIFVSASFSLYYCLWCGCFLPIYPIQLLCMDESSKYSNRQDIKTVSKLFGLNQSFRILLIKNKTGIMKNCSRFVLLVEASKKMLTKPKLSKKVALIFTMAEAAELWPLRLFWGFFCFAPLDFHWKVNFFLRNHNPAKHSCSVCNTAT